MWKNLDLATIVFVPWLFRGDPCQCEVGGHTSAMANYDGQALA